MKVLCVFCIVFVVMVLLVGMVFVQVKVGIMVFVIGLVVLFGILEKNIVVLLFKEIVGKKIEYIVFDDVFDIIIVVKNICKFIIEDKVDLVIGLIVMLNLLVMVDVVVESEMLMIILVVFVCIIELMDVKWVWVFKML